LLQHFTKALRKLHRYPKQFRPVLLAEAYLHAVNPWTLASAVLLLLVAAALGSGVATISLLAGVALLVLRPHRTWVIAQLYLIAGTVKNIKSKELAWTKQVKTLQTTQSMR
ncbi:MAG: hypothetical protein RMH84_06970, partial [Sulfolobales archaeon]|nr:hypothetical protein [Sulfolobales archaeon]